MSSFFLELNALIANRDWLRQLVNSRDYFFTSYWAIAEELINLNAGNYCLVRRLFRAISDSGIDIDWTDNFSILMRAFDVYLQGDGFGASAKRVYREIVEKNEYSRLSAEALSQIKMIAACRKLSNAERRILNDYQFIHDRSEVHRNADFEGNIALRMSIYALRNLVPFSQEEMIQRYDHSQDRYLQARGKSLMAKRLFDRNDLFDLEYFKYLQNDITYMVSDDHFIHFLDCKKVYRNAEVRKREHIA